MRRDYRLVLVAILATLGLALGTTLQGNPEGSANPAKDVAGTQVPAATKDTGTRPGAQKPQLSLGDGCFNSDRRYRRGNNHRG